MLTPGGLTPLSAKWNRNQSAMCVLVKNFTGSRKTVEHMDANGVARFQSSAQMPPDIRFQPASARSQGGPDRHNPNTAAKGDRQAEQTLCGIDNTGVAVPRLIRNLRSSIATRQAGSFAA
jgi:hypothetical protein